MTQMKRFFVRFSTSGDFSRILEFYDSNAHENVRRRQSEIMKVLVEDGSVILLEDELGKIVASSITYPHRAMDKNGVKRVMWQEIGTTRCVLNGYPGLFDAMVTMQTLRTILVEPPENVMVAQMKTAPVQNIAQKLGWRRLQEGPPPELLVSKAQTVSDGNGQVTSSDWFACGVEALPTMAKWMGRAMDSFILEHKATGEKIQLDFSRSSFFNMFHDEIRCMAEKSFGDADSPDQKQNVRKYRDRWLKNFYR